MSLYSSPNGLDGTFPARRHVHAWFFIGILLGLLLAVIVSLTILAVDSASPQTGVLVGVFDLSVIVAIVRRYLIWRRMSRAQGPRSRELRCVAGARDARRSRWLAAHPDRARGRGNQFSLKLHPGI